MRNRECESGGVLPSFQSVFKLFVDGEAREGDEAQWAARRRRGWGAAGEDAVDSCDRWRRIK